MPMERMHAGTLNFLACDIRVIHADATIADLNQLVFANIALFRFLINDPACYGIPFNQLKNFWVFSLHSYV